MREQRQRTLMSALAVLQTQAFLIASWLFASCSIAGAAEDIASEKAYLRSVVPQVSKPSPTAEQSERGFLAY